MILTIYDHSFTIIRHPTIIYFSRIFRFSITNYYLPSMFIGFNPNWYRIFPYKPAICFRLPWLWKPMATQGCALLPLSLSRWAAPRAGGGGADSGGFMEWRGKNVGFVGIWCKKIIYIYTYVCMYVCTYVRMYVCTYVRMYVCTYVRMYVCTYVRMYVCTYVRMYVCTYVRIVRTYVRTYVRMYVCMYVRMYVCMYVCVVM